MCSRVQEYSVLNTRLHVFPGPSGPSPSKAFHIPTLLKVIEAQTPPSHVRPLSQSAPGPGPAPSNVATRSRGSLKLVMHIANALAFAIHYPYQPLRPATRRTSFRGPRVRHIVHHSHFWDTWRRDLEIMMEVGSVTLAWDMTRTLWMRSMDVVLMNVTVVCFVLSTGMSASVSQSRPA